MQDFDETFVVAKQFAYFTKSGLSAFANHVKDC